MHPAAKAKYVAEQQETSRRAAKQIDCPKCGAPALKGDDDDRCAQLVTVDIEPADPVVEMLAVLNGQPTYNLWRGELQHREPWHVHSAREWGTVHTQHQCKEHDDTRLPALF